MYIHVSGVVTGQLPGEGRLRKGQPVPLLDCGDATSNHRERREERGTDKHEDYSGEW